MSETRARPRMRHPASMLDLNRFQSTAHGHDFDGLSRVVMVRKTDQRTFASAKNGDTPKFETVTRETIETFHGHRTERKVTSLEKKDVFKKLSPDFIDSLSSPTAQRSSTPKRSPVASAVPSVVRKKSSSSNSIKSSDDFAQECLNAHNEYRSKHGVPLMTLNKKICKVSQEWADHLAKKGILEHSKNREYGENLFSCWSSNPNYLINGREPVDSWYEEMKSHPFGTEPSSLNSGHFSQIVWKESLELGVAYSKSKDGKIFVVANYSPPGNFIGRFAENVPPVGGFHQNGTTESPSSAPQTPKDVKTNPVIGTVLQFEKDCLGAHNEYRQRHGVESLKLSRKLCKYSEEWAKVLATKGALEHRKNSDYGENIFCSWNSNPHHKISGREPVEKWYAEIIDHVFGREPSTLKSGHFTQVVWKDSQELGVGVAKNRNGQIFVVCNYHPPGNFVGSFTENVFPVGGTKKSSASPINLNTITEEDFAREGVRIHNEYRKKHGVPDLKFSQALFEYAKEWAQTLAREDKFYHRPDTRYGENIFYVWSSDPNVILPARDVCRNWYNEIKEYTWNTESRVLKAGHFTQMIWKSSAEMGMAMARGKTGKIFVVANYYPRGNIINQFNDNVPRLL